jgi:hypothetical protein
MFCRSVSFSPKAMNHGPIASAEGWYPHDLEVTHPLMQVTHTQVKKLLTGNKAEALLTGKKGADWQEAGEKAADCHKSCRLAKKVPTGEKKFADWRKSRRQAKHPETFGRSSEGAADRRKSCRPAKTLPAGETFGRSSEGVRQQLSIHNKSLFAHNHHGKRCK